MQRVALAVGTLWALASCHPPVEGSPERRCGRYSTNSLFGAARVARFMALVDGTSVPLADSAEVEVIANPSSEGSGAAFVAPLYLGFPADSTFPETEFCCTVSGLGPNRGIPFQKVGNLIMSSELQVSIGADLDSLEGRTLSLEATISCDRMQAGAAATIRPVNRDGYLSGR